MGRTYSYGQLGHVHDCIAYARVHTVTERAVKQHSHVVALMKRVSPRIWSVGALRLWQNRRAYGIFSRALKSPRAQRLQKNVASSKKSMMLGPVSVLSKRAGSMSSSRSTDELLVNW